MSENNFAISMLRIEIGSAVFWSFNLSFVSIAAAMNGADGWAQFGGVAAILFAMVAVDRICSLYDSEDAT